MNAVETTAETDALAEALCREYHPLLWDADHGNPDRPFGCWPCRVHAYRLAQSSALRAALASDPTHTQDGTQA